MNSVLPYLGSLEDYRRIYRQEQVWLPAMRWICDRHGLDAKQLAFAPPGTHVVFSVGRDRHVKLFSPLWSADYTAETLVLRALSQSDLPVPQLWAEGELEGWPYVIMSTVPGVPLNQVWPHLGLPDKRRIVRACGAFLSQLHAVPLVALQTLAVDWLPFVVARTESRVADLHRSSLGPRWSADVARFLESQSAFLASSFEPVLLCADVTDEHVMLQLDDGVWSFSGIIDFGDAMVGHPLYEFAAPACSITRGEGILLCDLLLGYGFPPDGLTETLADRLMTYTLLHRYIDLGELLEIFGLDGSDGLRKLRNRLWSFV